MTAIATALGWEQFAIAGISGGTGPCLAAAALLPDLVTRCAVVVGMAPVTVEEIQAGMREDDRRAWEATARGDLGALGTEFEEFLKWFDAGMPDAQIDEDSRRMLEAVVDEARRQGPAGYIDDNIAHARDWGFAVEDVQAPTMIVGAREDDHFMQQSARWLADHIPGAELLWREGGHLNPREDADPRLFHWLGHGVRLPNS